MVCGVTPMVMPKKMVFFTVGSSVTLTPAQALQTLFKPGSSFSRDQSFTGPSGDVLKKYGAVLSCAYAAKQQAESLKNKGIGIKGASQDIVVALENAKTVSFTGQPLATPFACGGFDSIDSRFTPALQRFFTNSLATVKAYNEPKKIYEDNEVVGKIANDLRQLINSIIGTLQSAQVTKSRTSDDSLCAEPGWFTAGSCYHKLVTTQASSSIGPELTASDLKFILAKALDSIPNLAHPSKISSEQTGLDMIQLLYQALDEVIKSSQANALPPIAEKTLSSLLSQYGEKIDVFKLGLGGEVFLRDLLTSYGSGSGQDPLHNLVDTGQNLISYSIVTLVAALATLFGVTLATNITDCSLPGRAVSTVTEAATTGAIAANAYMFSIGAILAYVIPLIPLILFYVSALGWLMTVAEAFVAAPIIALGLMWPDTQSHEIFGKAERALWLFLNILLRPVLIILGFVLGLFLLSVLIPLVQTFLVIAISSNVIDFDSLFAWIPLRCLSLGATFNRRY